MWIDVCRSDLKELKKNTFYTLRRVFETVFLLKPNQEFNSMLSQLIVDLEVVRSLVSQNGKKIGEIETDIKNKSEANQNEHQLIEGLNSN